MVQKTGIPRPCIRCTHMSHERFRRRAVLGIYSLQSLVFDRAFSDCNCSIPCFQNHGFLLLYKSASSICIDCYRYHLVFWVTSISSPKPRIGEALGFLSCLIPLVAIRRDLEQKSRKPVILLAAVRHCHDVV